ncbi:MAG: T9SS type A sorting domain-containing protein [Candidatus Marinimicrobia bacterium]|jgi:hypothetical protein|nr:T9SS type A sorting domain-containing protein [Candidatus Neomarinimicrobiota bacterium]MCK9559393.1 T9SS type A sorting domain-containing protein [Candidatus Neomarinimicrobiota bacterium]MDD5061466.1 T9SS type A sorting domain-containing protein [Candidatus Neomarinimicrobiota bacterium]
MRKEVNAFFTVLIALMVLGGVTVQAQVIDFEDMTIGDPIDAIGWGTQVAEVADDPVSSGNKVLKFTPNNYNSAPVLEFTLPAGKTLADYPQFKFKAYFQQGDVGWKDIKVEAYQAMPTAQFANVAENAIGTWNRASGASTAWEDITIDITGSAEMTGTVYIAFGINCAATGDQGGSGLTTIWYADNVDLGIEPPPVVGPLTTWGFINGRIGGWKIAVGEAGNANITGDGPPSGWAAIRGALPDTLEATTTDAVVVTGQIEFTGDDLDTWGPLRYGLFYHDSAATVLYAGTDSARWGGKEAGAYGYMFSPNSGTNDKQSGQGGNGTQWAIKGGSPLSTWSGGTMTMGDINPAPARAKITQGIYDFAFSVKDLGDSTNEVRFYMVKQDNSYWFGGTVIDTGYVTTKFNGIVFGKNGGNGAENTTITGVLLTNVNAYLGAPIAVPEKPWSPYYIDAWGTMGGRWGNWRLQKGDFVGDVSMFGDGPPTGSWASVRGAFLEPLEIKTSKAVIVRGSIEFVGDGLDTWGPLRYGFFYHDSAGALQIDSTQAVAGVDTTYYNLAWSGKENLAHGYMFSPQSGTNDLQSGQGGNGTQWAVNGGSPVSTWSGGTMTMGVVMPQPARAKITQGTYDFAMSVQDLGDGTNEVRWYFQKRYTGEQTSYWFGGTAIDTGKVTDKINGIYFAKNPGNGAENTTLTAFNLMEVEVDYGNPIIVTPKPWQPYYISDWGTAPGRWGGWRMQVGEFVGDVSMSGTPARTNWAAVRGGFVEPVEFTTEKAVIVSGSMEVVGDDINVWAPIRYGFFYHDSIGVLQIDSTQAIAGEDTTYYNVTWSGKENYAHGYMFSPNSGTNDRQSGQGGNGTQWSVNGGSWVSTWSGGTMTRGDVMHAPARAIITQGIYNFKMSVHKLPNGSNQVRYYFEKQFTGEQTTYWIGAIFEDPEAVTDKINGFCLGFDNNMGDINCTGYNLTEVQVDYGAPITLTEKPWVDYYIDKWGFSGDNLGGWDLTEGEFVGDVSIGGTSAPTGWSAIRGGFLEPFELSTKANRALIIRGQIELVGGGFQDVGSMRYGLFYSDSAGAVSVDPDLDSNLVWNGTDGAHSGYLFVPPSGSNIASWSNGEGTWGIVANDKWWDITSSNGITLGAPLQDPVEGVAGAGTYDFAISITPQSIGNIVKATLSKTDGTYYWAATHIIPVMAPAQKFNSVAFAINNSTTTQLNLIEIEVARGAHIDRIEDANPELPKVYALKQNYPNPFNPTTTIRFDLPKNSDVNLVVYDLMGREVAKLANGHMNAGYYTINFNAANLPSGVYIYRLKAGNFVSVKKLMLLK